MSPKVTRRSNSNTTNIDRWQKLRQTFRARIQTLSRLTPYQRDPKFVPPVVVSPPILMEFQYDSVYLLN